MELRRNIVNHYQLVLNESATWEQSAELIVPDSCPDIAYIVDTTGIACLKDKTIHTGGVELSGIVKAGILYRPEEETGLRKLDVNIPFQHMIEGTLEGTSTVLASTRVLSAEARTMNPRKVQVYVILLLEITAYQTVRLELTDGVVGDEDAQCEVLKKSDNAYLLTGVQEKAVTVTEELEVSASKPSIEDVLKADVRLTAGEMKPIGSKAVFKGMAFVRVLYASAGHPYTLEQEVPFSQIIEIDGLEESSALSAQLQLAGIDIDFVEGSEARKLNVTLYVDVAMLAWVDKKLEYVCDLYGIGQRILPQISELQLQALDEKNVRRQTVREGFEVGEDVSEVVDTAILLGPVSQQDGKTGCDCQVKLVYRTEDGAWSQAVRNMRVLCPAEEAAPGDVYAELSGEITATPAGGGIEVRYNVDFTVTVMQPRRLLTVAGLTIEDAAARDPDACNVVLRRCHEDESLWDIAKKYGSTRQELAVYNKLESIDTVPVGRVLLIPRSRG